MKHPKLIPLAVLMAGALLFSHAQAAPAPGFSFLRLVHNATPRPDVAANFIIDSPSTDGARVVFRSGDPFIFRQPADAVWAINVNGTGLTKLVGTATPAAGGVGNFSRFDADSFNGRPQLSAGVVLFPASDGSAPYNGGLYTVPVGGGAVSRVANYATANPSSGGNFSHFSVDNNDARHGFSIDRGQVAFIGDSVTTQGVYRATTQGASLAVIADSPSPCHPEFGFASLDGYTSPSILLGRVGFVASGIFDPVSGPNGLFLDGCSNELVNADTQLPGNPSTAAQHTRIGSLQLDGVRLVGGVPDVRRIAFAADDSFSSNYGGIFIADLQNGSLSKVVATIDSFPGFGTFDVISSYSIDNGSVAFNALNVVGNQRAIFIWNAGVITRLVGTGDVLADGSTVAGLSFELGPQSWRNGRLAFIMSVSGFGPSIYVASAPLTVQFSSTGFAATEGAGLATITVTRLGNTQSAATVNFSTASGTASQGTDFSATSGTLSFAAGQTARTFTVPVSDDALTEATETVSLTLSSPTGATLGTQNTATLLIRDNEPTQFRFTAPSFSVMEGVPLATISVFRLGNVSLAGTVNFATSNGNALAGSDYTLASGTLNFAVNQNIQTFSVPISNDAVVEGSEFVNLALNTPAGGTLVAPSTAILLIRDNEPSQFRFSAPTYSVTEGTPNVTIMVFRLGNVSAPGAVNFATSNGTAAATLDYTAVNSTLNFPVNVNSVSVNVPIINDVLVEPNQTVNLGLNTPSGAVLVAPSSAVLTIVSND